VIINIQIEFIIFNFITFCPVLDFNLSFVLSIGFLFIRFRFIAIWIVLILIQLLSMFSATCPTVELIINLLLIRIRLAKRSLGL